jgi:hypothetical protein
MTFATVRAKRNRWERADSPLVSGGGWIDIVLAV